MRNKIVVLIVLLVIILVLLAINLFVNKNVQDEPVLGGDIDEHGCIGSAGYTWCELKQKCLRSWEESCLTETELNIKQISCEEDGGEWFADYGTCERNWLRGEECNSLGGNYNSCNSACRHDPSAEFCIEACIETCTFF